MHVARNIYLDSRIVPGGGAVEMEVSRWLSAKAKTIDGVIQGPYKAVCSALEIIPRTLANNCGANTMRTITALRAKHAEGTNANWGIDGVTGQVSLLFIRRPKISIPILI